MKVSNFNRKGYTSLFVLFVLVVIVSLATSYTLYNLNLNKISSNLEKESDYSNFLNSMIIKAKNYDLLALDEPLTLDSTYKGDKHTIEIKRENQNVNKTIVEDYNISWVTTGSGDSAKREISKVSVSGNKSNDYMVYLDFTNNELNDNSSFLPQAILKGSADSLNPEHIVPTDKKILTKRELSLRYKKEYSYIIAYVNGKENPIIIRNNITSIDSITNNEGAIIVLHYVDSNNNVVAWSRYVQSMRSTDYANAKSILVTSLPVSDSFPYIYEKDLSGTKYNLISDPIKSFGKTNSLAIGDLTTTLCRYEQVKNPLSLDSDAGHTKGEIKYIGFGGSPCDPTSSGYKTPTYAVTNSPSWATRPRTLAWNTTPVTSYINGLNNIDIAFMDRIINFDTTSVLGKRVDYTDRLYCSSDPVKEYIEQFFKKKGIVNPHHFTNMYGNYTQEILNFLNAHPASGIVSFSDYIKSVPSDSAVGKYYKDYDNKSYIDIFVDHLLSKGLTTGDFNDWFNEKTNNYKVDIPCLGGKDYDSLYIKYTKYINESNTFTLSLVNNIDYDYNIEVRYNKINGSKESNIKVFEFSGEKNFAVNNIKHNTNISSVSLVRATFKHFFQRNVKYLQTDKSLTDIDVNKDVTPQGLKFTTSNAIITGIKVTYNTLDNTEVTYLIRNSKGEIVKDGKLTFD